MTARSGHFNVGRAGLLEAAATVPDDLGLLVRLWADLRWTPAEFTVDGRPVSLSAGQALVSLSAYARELGFGRARLRAGLGRLVTAGWFRAEDHPCGKLLTCLRHPAGDSGYSPPPVNNSEDPGLKSTTPLVDNRPPPWSIIDHPPGLKSTTYSNTPSVAPVGSTPAGPKVAFDVASQDNARAPGPRLAAGHADLWAAVERAQPGLPYPAYRDAARAAGVPFGEVAGQLVAGRVPQIVLGWLGKARRTPPRDPAAWFASRCNELISEPPADDLRAARAAIYEAGALPGLEFPFQVVADDAAAAEAAAGAERRRRKLREMAEQLPPGQRGAALRRLDEMTA